MAQLLCISSVLNLTAVQETGDIVGVFEDGWEFSPDELAKFTIIQVDLSRAEVLAILDELRHEEAVMWRDGEVWKERKEKPKFGFSIKSLSQEDRAALTDEKVSDNDKQIILRKITNRTADLSINQEEVNK